MKKTLKIGNKILSGIDDGVRFKSKSSGEIWIGTENGMEFHSLLKNYGKRKELKMKNRDLSELPVIS